MIINLMVAWLEDCRAFFFFFFVAVPTAVFIYTVLFFPVPLVMFSFIKTHMRLPAALSQGLSFHISRVQL